ncbi:MAG TPA: hypothetical protein VEH84_10450 [Alphaproteobacteria bacterium]|nr:hypothetical protein [Alphaproteobacteria bacterium]
MTTIPARLALGFAAAALSHVVFQGALGTILHAAGLVPGLVWSLAPVPPLGVPATLNNMFWDGLWGMLYAAAEPRLTARFGRLSGGLALGLASLLVFWFVVLPLKGAGIGGLPGIELAIDLAFDLTFGVGTAALFWLGLRLARREAAAPPLRG